MRRLFIEIEDHAFEELQKTSDAERRPVKDQAAVELERAVGIRSRAESDLAPVAELAHA